MKQFANAKLSAVIASIILSITLNLMVPGAERARAQEQLKTTGPQSVPQALPNHPAASVDNSAVTAPTSASTYPMPQGPKPPSDLLAAVRSQVSQLRSIPISGGSDVLRDSKAHRDADQIKILHDWQGDSTAASWPFNVTIGKSTK